MSLVHCCGAGCGITVPGIVDGVTGALSGPSGFGTARHWSRAVGAAPTIVSSNRYLGAKCYQWDSTGAAAIRYLGKDVTGGPTVAVARFVVEYKTFPNVDTDCFVFSTAAGSFPGMRYEVSSGKLTPSFGGNKSANGIVIQLNKRYVVDIIVNVSANPKTINARINKAVIPQHTIAQAATTITGYRHGVIVAATTKFQISDFAFSITGADYPLGNGIVKTVRPNRDGTHYYAGSNPSPEAGEDPAFNPSDFEYNDTTVALQSANDFWTYLDEFPPTVADFLAQTILNERSYIEIGFESHDFPYPAQGIEVVSIHHAGKKTITGSDTTSNRQSAYLRHGTWEHTIFEDADMSHGIRPVYNSKHIPFHPVGRPWTRGQLDIALLRWGYGADVDSVPYLDGVLLEVALPIPGFPRDINGVYGDGKIKGDWISATGGTSSVSMSDGKIKGDLFVLAKYDFAGNYEGRLLGDIILRAQVGRCFTPQFTPSTLCRTLDFLADTRVTPSFVDDD